MACATLHGENSRYVAYCHAVRLLCGLDREATEELFGLATLFRKYGHVDQAGPRLHDYPSSLTT